MSVTGTGRSEEFGRLYTTLTTSDLDNHLAFFYRTEAEQRSSIVQYIQSGLDKDYRCLYIADEHDTDEIARWLSTAGIPVGDLREAGALTILDSSNVYGAEDFDPEATVGSFGELAESAVHDGFRGLHAAGENTWGFDVSDDLDDLIHFERNFDERAPDLPATAVCQYDIDQFDDSVLADALRIHSQIIWDGALIENPYYEPDEESTGGTAELLLDQSRDISQSRRAVRRREERLSVVNRVLRHNLRNETNVVLGRAEILREDADLDDLHRDHLETIESVTERLLDLSDQARYIDRTIGGLTHDYRSAAAATETAIDRAESDLGVTIEQTITTETAFVVDDAAQSALYEILAIFADTGDDLSVTVERPSEHGLLSLTVETETSSIEPLTAHVLDGCTEDALQHCLGMRAWIARWLVDLLDGTVQIDNEGPAAVELTVPAARRHRAVQ